MICLICNQDTRLNKGICRPCRDKILRPHYIAPIILTAPAGGAKNGK